MKKIAFLTFALIIVSSCNSTKSCKYEAGYNSVSDSLKVAIKKNRMTELTKEKIFSDFTSMSCADYQKKYGLSDNDLALSIQSVRTTISVLGAFESIEENTQAAEDNEIDRLIESGNEASEELKEMAE